MLSTQHGDGQISTKNNYKPLMILNYNSTKERVNSINKLIKEYSYGKKTAYKKIQIGKHKVSVKDGGFYSS